MSIVFSSLTTIVSSVYPNVGNIVGFVGAFCGLYFIYVLPICFHIHYSKPVYNQSSNPSVMKIALTDEEMTKTQKPPKSMKSWKIDSMLHSSLILFGLVVVLFQFWQG
jgi:hypothetical protein